MFASRCSAHLACCVILLLVGATRAEVRLPAVISDHMVLQAGRKATLWGWADADESITVSIAGQSRTVSPTGADHRWTAEFDSLPAGGPHTLTIAGRNTVQVQDVLIGEVWLGSGQSNMNMRVSACRHFENEKDAAAVPQIRMFTEGSGAAKESQAVGKGTWVVCSPDTVGTFSGTLYFFGREIHRELKTPVGLIHSSVGGTPIESWISPEAQRSSPDLKEFFDEREKELSAFDAAAAKVRYEKQLAAWKEAVARAKAEGKPRPRAPRDPIAANARRADVGGLFNGKVAPLVPYTLRGVLWYQGEANTAGTKPQYYERQLRLLVTDWRSRWGQETLPFAWVQLPNFEGANRDFPAVREAMRRALTLPETGMAITIDIGEARDIHPKNKQDVGRRLAAWALGTVYGRDVVISGPLPRKAETTGSQIRITFDHAEGLASRSGPLTGFEVQGADGQWRATSARVDSKAVVLTPDDVDSPKAVRYAWINNPSVALYNAAGLPASPFSLEVGRNP